MRIILFAFIVTLGFFTSCKQSKIRSQTVELQLIDSIELVIDIPNFFHNINNVLLSEKYFILNDSVYFGIPNFSKKKIICFKTTAIENKTKDILQEISLPDSINSGDFLIADGLVYLFNLDKKSCSLSDIKTSKTLKSMKAEFISTTIFEPSIGVNIKNAYDNPIDTVILTNTDLITNFGSSISNINYTHTCFDIKLEKPLYKFGRLPKAISVAEKYYMYYPSTIVTNNIYIAYSFENEISSYNKTTGSFISSTALVEQPMSKPFSLECTYEEKSKYLLTGSYYGRLLKNPFTGDIVRIFKNEMILKNVNEENKKLSNSGWIIFFTNDLNNGIRYKVELNENSFFYNVVYFWKQGVVLAKIKDYHDKTVVFYFYKLSNEKIH